VEPIPESRQVLDDLVRHGDVAVATTLLRTARQAGRIVPDLVGLSLGVLEEDLTFTLEATDHEIAALDMVQYLDGGPCVAGAHEDAVIEVRPDALAGDLMDEDAWHLFARASAAAGVASTLTLPLEHDGRVVGSINLYAATPEAFEGRHEALAAALGSSAGAAVANADLSFSTRLRAVGAPAQLADRDAVDIAVGIVAAQQGVDVATARERLHAAAARGGITDAEAARAIRSLLEPGT
jgi:GAF domain-containing protein